MNKIYKLKRLDDKYNLPRRLELQKYLRTLVKIDELKLNSSQLHEFLNTPRTLLLYDIKDIIYNCEFNSERFSVNPEDAKLSLLLKGPIVYNDLYNNSQQQSEFNDYNKNNNDNNINKDEEDNEIKFIQFAIDDLNLDNEKNNNKNNENNENSIGRNRFESYSIDYEITHYHPFNNNSNSIISNTSKSNNFIYNEGNDSYNDINSYNNDINNNSENLLNGKNIIENSISNKNNSEKLNSIKNNNTYI
jgi:hypothetical protein